MGLMTMSECLEMNASIRKRCADYLKNISLSQAKKCSSILERMERMIERRERYKKLCGSVMSPTVAQTNYWLELWHRNFNALESNTIKLVQSNEKLEQRIKLLLTEAVAFLMQQATLDEDKVISVDIKKVINDFINMIASDCNISHLDLQTLFEAELSMPVMSETDYQACLKEHQEKLNIDPVYGCLVLDEYGSYLGDVELKLDEAFEDFVRRNPYYKNLMLRGCILTTGPNVNNLVGTPSIYCVNYEEMYEKGVLEKGNNEDFSLS